jgi:hypothetical protein
MHESSMSHDGVDAELEGIDFDLAGLQEEEGDTF